jgi:hypothetical protein
MADRFLAVRCPGCSSSHVTVMGPDKFRCDHCALVFVYDRRSPPPPARPSPRPAPPPAAAYTPPPEVRASGSAAGVIVSLIVAGVVASAGAAVFFVVSDLDTHSATITHPETRTEEVSVRVTSQGPLPCEDLAERYRRCLVENEDHSEDEARAEIEPIRAAVAAALATGNADDEASACAAELEPRLERCEGGGGLLGRLRPSSGSTKDAADEDDERPSLLGRLRGEPEEPPPPVDMARFQPLGGCECRASRNRPRVELNISPRGSKTVVGDPDYEYVDYTVFDWALTRDDEPWQLPTTMKTAPPEALPGWRSTMGMTCTDDAIVIASIRYVSAWSLADRRLLWTAELEAPFGDDFAQGRRNSYSLSCRNLTVRNGVVEIPLDRRRRLRLGLADGKPR